MPKTLYEMMYIVRPDVTDEALEELRERVSTHVTQSGGDVERNQVMDRRDLAYEIDGCLRGTYCMCYFEAEGSVIDELRREMELDEQILRYGCFLANPRAIWKPLEMRQAEAAAEAAAAAAEAEANAPEEAPAEEAAPEEAAADAPAETPADTPAETPAETPADAPAETPAAEATTEETTEEAPDETPTEEPKPDAEA